MGSVLDYVECKSCGFEQASSDYYYKSDEMYVFCPRCGYSYNRQCVLSKSRTKKVYDQVKSLFEAGKIEEAHKAAGIRYTLHTNNTTIKSDDVDIERKSEDIKDFLKRCEDAKFKLFYKLDKNGLRVYKEEEQSPGGVFSYSQVGACGSCLVGITKLDDFIKFFKANRDKFKSCSYTFKKGDKWFVKDLINDKESALDEGRLWN